jgi:hypothetical protein
MGAWEIRLRGIASFAIDQFPDLGNAGGGIAYLNICYLLCSFFKFRVRKVIMRKTAVNKH